MLSFEPLDDPDIDSVWLWFQFQIALIREERGRVLRMFRPGIAIVAESLRPPELQFVDFTRAEVEEFFDAQRDRLELLTMLELLATTEAALRIEFESRVSARKKDGLSRRFRELRKKHGDKIELNEHILVPLKDEGVAANVIAAFRGTLGLRHWLAHGRHWRPKLGRGYSHGDVFDIARALIESIPPS
jgi:hypothetical protein